MSDVQLFTCKCVQCGEKYSSQVNVDQLCLVCEFNEDLYDDEDAP